MSPRTPETGPPPGPGTGVWLEDLPGGPWASIVIDVRHGLMCMAPPRLAGREVRLPATGTCTVAYRVREVPCRAPAELVPGPPGAGGSWLRLTGPPVRLQRREAVRVPVQLLAVAQPAGSILDSAAVLSGIAEDLSASGVMVRTDRSLEPGHRAEVVVHAGGELGDLQAHASVVRCERQEGHRSRPWRIAFAFDGLERSDQDRVMRYLFERQREMRRREIDRG